MEKIKGIEGEEVTSEIDLRFFRHDAKEGGAHGQDAGIRLSREGREHALSKSDGGDLDQAVGFGSSRVRSQETAALIMGGGHDGVGVDKNFEEVKMALEEDMALGDKIGVDDRLNFVLSKESGFADPANKAFAEGRYLKFLVEESDKLAEELGDLESSTYERQARSIASIVLKYLKISERWDELVRDESRGYEKTLKRFFGSHQGVLESFLAKVLELTRGVEERDRFVNALNGQGFGYSEGYDVTIKTLASGEKMVHLTYKRRDEKTGEEYIFDEDIDQGLLEKMAQ